MAAIHKTELKAFKKAAYEISMTREGCPDLNLGLFIQESQWNGLIRLDQNGSANHMIVSDCDRSLFDFDALFGLSGEARDFHIVMASPDLLATIHEYQSREIKG